MIKRIAILIGVLYIALSSLGSTKYTPCDEHKYPSTMTLTAVVSDGNNRIACEIAAFAPDGECRGAALTSEDDNLAFLTIQGDSEPCQLTFRIVTADDDYLAAETLTFVSNDMVGTPGFPFVFGRWTLIDGNPYQSLERHSDIQLLYKRTFPHSEWQALFVPVNMPLSVLNKYGQVAELTGITSQDGVETLWWTSVGGDEIAAGHPYLFKPHSDVRELNLNLTGVTLEPCDITATSSVVFDGVTYTVYGTYVEKTDMASSGSYALINGRFDLAKDDSVVLRPQRIYLHVSGDENSDLWIGNGIGEIGHGGVQMVLPDEDPDAPIYDLQGRTVSNPSAGIYIRNHKLIIK